MQGPRGLSPTLLAGLAARWGELKPYALPGGMPTFMAGEALVYILLPQGGGPPWEYLADEETVDELLQADDTFMACVGEGAADVWAVPVDEAAFLIEGRVPQADSAGRRAWRYSVSLQQGRWLLRAESNPNESVDVTGFHNRAPK